MPKSTVQRRRRHLHKLIEIYENGCFWCGVSMVRGFHSDPMNATIDELLPRSRGGRIVIENQVPAHNECNRRRSNMVAPHSAFERHHNMLRKHGLMPPGNGNGGDELNRIRISKGGLNMPDFKQTNASDNPDHEQTERDRAQKRKEAADAAVMANQQTSAEEKAKEAQQGRGPAGQNKGPSDTTSVDPHNPPDGGGLRGGQVMGQQSPASDGMGRSPPTRQTPGSDKPEDEISGPAERAYNLNPSPENMAKRDQERADRAAAKKEQRDANADLARQR